MSKREVIIKSSFEDFIPNKKLKQFIKECGYESIYEVNARMDSRIIKFLKDNSNCQDIKKLRYIGVKEQGYLRVVEVDTSQYWMIDEYDGAEGIDYIDIIDKELKLCKGYYEY